MLFVNTRWACVRILILFGWRSNLQVFFAKIKSRFVWESFCNICLNSEGQIFFEFLCLLRKVKIIFGRECEGKVEVVFVSNISLWGEREKVMNLGRRERYVKIEFCCERFYGSLVFRREHWEYFCFHSFFFSKILTFFCIAE